MFVLVLVLVVAGVVLAAIFMGRGRETPAAPGGGPGIVPGAGGPPPSIFAVKPGAAVTPPVGKDWAVATNPSYEYQFEYPTDWLLSIPSEYTQARARMLVSRTLASVAIVVIPFGLYDQDEGSEVAKAENAYLGPHSLEQDAKETVDGHSVLRRSYMCTLPEGGETRKARAVFIVSRPKCYAVFIRGTEEEMTQATSVFDRVVKSFRLEKVPLRNDKETPPPPPGASGSPGRAVPGSPPPLTPGVPSAPASVQTTPTPAQDASKPSPAVVVTTPSPFPAGPSASPPRRVEPSQPPPVPAPASSGAVSAPRAVAPRIVLPSEPPPQSGPSSAPPSASSPAAR